MELITLEDEELDKILCSLPSTTKEVEVESEVPPKQPMQEELDTLRRDVQNLQSLLEKNHQLLERLVNENANHLAHLHLLILGQKAQYTKVYYILFFCFIDSNIFFSFQERLQYQFQLEAYGKICQYYAAPGDQ